MTSQQKTITSHQRYYIPFPGFYHVEVRYSDGTTEIVSDEQWKEMNR